MAPKPEDAAAAPAKKAAARPASKPKPRKPGRRKPVGQSAFVLWAPHSLRGRLQAARRATGKTYADLVLDALEANAERLAELVAAATVPHTVKGALFERERPEPIAEPKTQILVRGLTVSQQQLIEQLAAENMAKSPSQLVVLALDDHLA